jgi:hypothetical protein
MDGFEIGGMLLTDRPRVVEVGIEDLAGAMRRAAARPGEGAALGAAASARIRSEHTWDRTAAVAEGRLQALAAGARPVGAVR